MGGVEPDVGVPDVGRVTFLQVGDRVVERGAHPRHLAGAHAVYAHGLRHALHLAGGHAVGHHLGDRGGDRAVHARVTLDQALGEEAPRAQLRNPEVDVPDESIVLGLIGSVSTLFLPCRYTGWLIPLNVVLPVPFALATLPECGNQGPQGNESDECLDNQIGDVYNDVKSHWMVTGLASWGDNSNSE